MATPVIDAEALREFLDKATPYFSSDYLSAVSAAMARRTRALQADWPGWPALWDRTPVGRKLRAETRQRWQPELNRLLPGIRAGDGDGVMAALARVPERPPWLTDWVTYWLHAGHPELVWWARWIYRPDNRTGALLLIVDDPTRILNAGGLAATYRLMGDATRYLGSVLALTHPLDDVEESYRPAVALASVYAVYMFTMAAWKMTEEFTKVLPPLPVVIRTLLGLTRWEGKHFGAKGQTD